MPRVILPCEVINIVTKTQDRHGNTLERPVATIVVEQGDQRYYVDASEEEAKRVAPGQQVQLPVSVTSFAGGKVGHGLNFRLRQTAAK